MKKLVCWSFLLLAMSCSKSGDKTEKRIGELTNPEGSTIVQSVQAAETVQPAASVQEGSTVKAASEPAPTSTITKALADKEVEDVSWNSRRTLFGIKSVTLVVWGFVDPEAVKTGLTQEVFFSVAKEKLEKAGIKVYKVGENNPDPGRAHVYVKLDVRKREKFPVYMGIMDLSLFQYVYLGRNPKQILLSETWSTHMPSFLYAQETLVEYCRVQLQGELDSFLKDYALFNPDSKAAADLSSSKSKPPADVKAAPSAKPSQTENKQPASESPATVPKPAPGNTVKPAATKPSATGSPAAAPKPVPGSTVKPTGTKPSATGAPAAAPKPAPGSTVKPAGKKP
jgi:hypothetical protein